MIQSILYKEASIYLKQNLAMIDETSLSPENRQRLSYLSSFLREMRVNSGYTQEQVAQEINLSRNSISKIENMGFYRIQHLFLLADYYEIPLNELFMDIK